MKITRLPSGKYHATLMLGYRYESNGQRVRNRVSITEDSEAKVRARANALRGQTAAGHAPRVGLERRPLGDYLQSWLETKRPQVSYVTWIHYRHAVGLALPLLGSLRLGETTPDQLRHTYLRLQAESGLSARVVRGVHTVLHQAFAQADADGLGRNPVAHVQPPRYERQEIRALTPDAVDALLRVAAGTPWYALWVLAFATGARSGELRALGRRHVTLPDDPGAPGGGRGAITIHRTIALDDRANGAGWRFKEVPKSQGGRRTIVVPPAAVAVLQAQLQRAAALPANPHDLVFSTDAGEPLRDSTVSHAFLLHAKRAGLTPPPHFHVCRHTYASVLLGKRRALPEVAYLMGHTIAVLSQVYAHWIEQSTLDACDAVADVLRLTPESVASAQQIAPAATGRRRHTEWPPCVRCGDAGGTSTHPGAGTPSRISGARFGLDGLLCRKCWDSLYQAQRRAASRARGR